MTSFKVVISDPGTRKSYQAEIEQDKAIGLIGKKINDEFNGDIIGLNNYILKITGGTDKDGFPMHPSVQGQGKKKILLDGPPGFHPKLKGQRKRKTVRGNVISNAIAQINVKVVKKGERALEEIFGKKEETKGEPTDSKQDEIKNGGGESKS